MTGRLWFITCLVGITCLIAVAFSWSRASSLRTRVEFVTQQRDRTKADVAELEKLRLATQHAMRGKPAENSLLPMIHDSLGDAGISKRALKQVSRPNDQRTGRARNGGTLYALRTERLVLDPIRLSELGRWMKVWRATEPLWTISFIELRSNRETESNGAYAVTVDLTTVFMNAPARIEP